ncbi:MAG: transcription termination factor NusA [Streptococcaceae bacterium]|jgi:N utilization substance protein A|nr:transcription termination factor NusA [Streptococcaceae bacterium]
MAKKAQPQVDVVALFSQIAGMKGVKPEIIIEALKDGIVAAYKKQYGQAQNVEVTYDEANRAFQIYSVREVVDEVFDSRLEISLTDARQLNDLYEIGDKIRFQEELKDFARGSIGVAKQSVLRRLKEEEQHDILREYQKYEDEMISGIVDRVDDKAIFIKLGRVDAMLMKFDQIRREKYKIGERISVYVTKVTVTPKGVRVYVSRTAPEMLKRIFEKEVPEVADGTVEIMSIAREAGERAKVVVRSHNEKVDAIGAMVGSRGSRIQPIINDLHGENMDIIEWSPDQATLVRNVLKPATVSAVYTFEDGSALAVVPDDQLSLAIGKRGQNVRLAVQVAHCKIDIKKASEFDESELETEAVEAPEVDAHGEVIVALPETPMLDADQLKTTEEEQQGLAELLDAFDEEEPAKEGETDNDEDGKETTEDAEA